MTKETTQMFKTYAGISFDTSISMSGIRREAANDYNVLVSSIKEGAEVHNLDTIVSIVKCGVGRAGTVEKHVTLASTKSLKTITHDQYIPDGNSTPLYDSVGALIEQFENVPDAADPNVSFLIQIVTDGQENSSRNWSALSLANKIRALQATDRWTFVFHVPRGAARSLSRTLGIPEGNFLEWDTTSGAGMQASTAATQAATASYFTARAAGAKSTGTFYSSGLQNVSATDVKAALTDISGEVQLWTVQTAAEGNMIRTFVEGKLGDKMLKGAAFYQLTPKKDGHEVQEYKKILIRDKKTKAIYYGNAARQLIGLPTDRSFKLKPGQHENFEVFVQSTSVNRKLPVGSQLIYWPAVGVAFK